LPLEATLFGRAEDESGPIMSRDGESEAVEIEEDGDESVKTGGVG